MTTRRNFLTASDGFDERFIVWFLHNPEAREPKQFVSEKGSRPNLDEFSYRIINHWQENGLIEDERTRPKGWRKFSISDIVWLHILNELRNFGYSIDNLKKVKEELEYYKDEEHKISQRPLLDYYLLHAMMNKEPVFLLAFQNGEALVAFKHEIELALSTNTIDGNYISISINELIAKVFPNTKHKVNYFNDLNLKKPELELLNTIRDSKVKSVQLKTRNGTIVSMDSLVEEDIDTKVGALLNMAKFQRIVLEEHNGKVTKIERTIKQRP